MVIGLSSYRTRGITQLKVILNIFLFSFLVGCSGSNDDPDEPDFSLEGTNLSIAEISGSWVANRAIVREIANSSNTIDIVEEGGSVTLTILNNGRFTGLISPISFSGLEIQGQMGFDGSRLLIIEDGFDLEDAAVFTVSVNSNDQLLLNGPLELPIDPVEGFVPVNIDLRMDRQ